MTTYLIFSDVDGTLMIDHTQLTTATQHTLQQVMALGHQFYIASGRMLPLARHAAKQIGGPVKVIAANGATFEQNDHLITTYLTAEQLDKIYEAVLGFNCKVFFLKLTACIIPAMKNHTREMRPKPTLWRCRI